MTRSPQTTTLVDPPAGTIEANQALHAFADVVARGGTLEKQPLLILGAGISNGIVPLLDELGAWLHKKLEHLNVGGDDAELTDRARALSERTASRRQVAELFSRLQSTRPADKLWAVWGEFSERLLYAGLEIGETKFEGMTRAHPAEDRHIYIADALCRQQCWAISLNFDGLIHKALRRDEEGLGASGLSLHSNEGIENYFCSDARDSLPAVFNVRGDVFYATCTEPLCPRTGAPYPVAEIPSPVERSGAAGGRLGLGQSVLDCDVCGSGKLSLQFSFPGLRAKEELAFPLLWTLRHYLAGRISCIIVLGLSGSWDRYLLDFLFDVASERDIPILDVKPMPSDENPIDAFRAAHYPSVSRIPGGGLASPASYTTALYTPVDCTAEVALPVLLPRGDSGAVVRGRRKS